MGFAVQADSYFYNLNRFSLSFEDVILTSNEEYLTLGRIGILPSTLFTLSLRFRLKTPRKVHGVFNTGFWFTSTLNSPSIFPIFEGTQL